MYSSENGDGEPKEGPVGVARFEEEEEASVNVGGGMRESVRVVNARRTAEDDRKIWGGKMVDSIHDHEGSISHFSDECLSVHGLYDALYSRNGWLRTVSYLFMWVAFGCLFLYLTIPQVKSFQEGNVNTHVSFEESLTSTGAAQGLPLPILTVCPRGSGIRCDCNLWRRLYCRYTVDLPDKREWRRRFVDLACINDLSFDFNGDTVWNNANCDQHFGPNSTTANVDVCDPTPQQIAAVPEIGEFTGERLFARILERENTMDGPYLTNEEENVYGILALSNNVVFFRHLDYLTVEPIPEEWVTRSYLDPTRTQVCVHLRPPMDVRQTTPGSRNGIAVLITNINTELSPLRDVGEVSPTVDVHVNVIAASRYSQPSLVVERHEFFPVPAGFTTDIGYGVQSLERSRGYGLPSSKKCNEDVNADPRFACVQESAARLAHEVCGCPNDASLLPAGFFSNSGVKDIPTLTCSNSFGTVQADCVEEVLTRSSATLEECPVLCTSFRTKMQSKSQVTLSALQRGYLQILQTALSPSPNRTNSTIELDETAVLNVGLHSLSK